MQQRAKVTANCEGLFWRKHNKLQMQMEAVATMGRRGKKKKKEKKEIVSAVEAMAMEGKIGKSPFYLPEKCQTDSAYTPKLVTHSLVYRVIGGREVQ